MAGFVTFLVIAATVWVGGCSLHRHFGNQRESVYAEIWTAAPELKRAHQNLKTELTRLNEFRKELKKRKRMFKTDEGKMSADVKIETVDWQIERLENQIDTIMGAVEQQSLTNLASKVENPLQREKIRSLEAKAAETVRDAVSLRKAIEAGVNGNRSSSKGAVLEPARAKEVKSARSKELEPASLPEMKKRPEKINGDDKKEDDPYKQAKKGLRSIPKAVIVDEKKIAMRTWRDRNGHRVSARLLAVLDSRENAVRVVGKTPSRLVKAGYFVQLQRVDGKIIKVPIEKFSSRDLDFLSRGG